MKNVGMVVFAILVMALDARSVKDVKTDQPQPGRSPV
jgi:hypothetical protein